MTFCTDTDLLNWEPNLPKEASFAAQTLISGQGDLAGTVFTIGAGSLTDAHVEVGQVLVLSGLIEGCFPIVAVNSATGLVVSTLYDDPETELDGVIGTATGLGFAIRTFWPQRKVVSDLLLQAA